MEKDSTSITPTGTTDKITEAEIVNQLFVRMAAIKPAWQTAYKGNQELLDQARREWLKGFKENGINTLELLEKGLAKAREDQSDFWPSVGKFIGWCLGTENSTRLFQTFLRLIKMAPDQRRWDQYVPKLYWIYCDIGTSNVRAYTPEQLEKAFFRSLETANRLESTNYPFKPFRPVGENKGITYEKPTKRQTRENIKNLRKILDN